MRKLVKDNAPEVLRILLKELKVKYSDTTLNELKENPYFPDLISISQTLSKLSIENAAIKADYDQLLEFPKPFIVHIHDNGGMYLVVKSVDENNITFIVEKNKEEIQSKEEFLRSWTGYTLLINTENNNAIEKEYSTNLIKQRAQKLRLPILTIAMVFFLYFFLKQSLGSYHLILFKVLSLIGFVVSILLLTQLIDKNNLFVKKVCSAKNNKKINCSSILNSKAAKFFGLISWSEIGFVYFLSQIITFLIFNNAPINYLAVLSIVASPYVFYSIYYQWIVAKTWCKLCLLIQLVLIAQTTVSILMLSNSTFFFSGNWLLDIIYILFIPILIFTLLSYILTLTDELIQKKEQLKLSDRIKMQPNIFYSQLNNGVDINQESISDILLTYGNKKPTNHLLLVINPTCEPCIRKHQILSEIASYNENIQISEVFLVEKEDSQSYDLAIKMVEIYLAESESYFKEAISNYYNNYVNKGNKWIKKYWKPKYKTERSSEIVEAHIKWILSKGITNTPQVICNGKFLPIEYTINDLEYLLY